MPEVDEGFRGPREEMIGGEEPESLGGKDGEPTERCSCDRASEGTPERRISAVSEPAVGAPSPREVACRHGDEEKGDKVHFNPTLL
jgi:hypothetical protein